MKIIKKINLKDTILLVLWIGLLAFFVFAFTVKANEKIEDSVRRPYTHNAQSDVKKKKPAQPAITNSGESEPAIAPEEVAGMKGADESEPAQYIVPRALAPTQTPAPAPEPYDLQKDCWDRRFEADGYIAVINETMYVEKNPGWQPSDSQAAERHYNAQQALAAYRAKCAGAV